MPARSLLAAARRSVRRGARRAGFDLVRYDATHSPERRRELLIAERAIDVVLDVGANSGPFARQLRENGYSGPIVSFEPQSAVYAELEEASRADGRWRCLRVALGAAEGEAELHLAGNSSSSSLLEMERQHVLAAPESGYVGTETVTVRRLDSLRESLVPSGARVYLKVDVQGFELEVLRGADETLGQTEIVDAELSLVPLYDGAPRLMDIVDHLGRRGFHPVALEPAFVDPRDGRLLQVNGLFVRAHG